ncbi:MAG: hypothetical protein AAF587_28010 [Bacteroidota bacterium]
MKILVGLILIEICGPICLAQVNPQLRLSALADTLYHRLGEETSRTDLPEVRYQADLPANARYESGTILVGSIQSDYQTMDDSLSILLHEYHHYLQELAHEFLICEDSAGNIPQWSTGQIYEYVPTSEEIERDLQQTIGPWLEAFSEEQQQIELRRLKRDLSRPRKMLFVYAPSRLAEAEIDAYEAQLEGEQAGLYQLSEEARHAIIRRLGQLKDTLERRRRYEQTHGLHPAGCSDR